MVKEVHRKSGLVYGNSSGFTFLEILVVLAIIAIVLFGIFPRMGYRGTRPIDELADRISRVTRLAYVRAVMSGKVHRVLFSFGNAPQVRVEAEEGRTSTGSRTFGPVADMIIQSSFAWDMRFEVANFFITGIDEARDLKDAWFFVVPVGLAQDVIINIIDRETGDRCGLSLNPFSVKFTTYDDFQRPY